MIDEKTIGKCGFYCGSCPDYAKGECEGCLEAHKTGDCFTRDCVIGNDIEFCGKCKDFPCSAIIENEKCTVLDKNWLIWKRAVLAAAKDKPDN